LSNSLAVHFLIRNPWLKPRTARYAQDAKYTKKTIYRIGCLPDSPPPAYNSITPSTLREYDYLPIKDGFRNTVDHIDKSDLPERHDV